MRVFTAAMTSLQRIAALVRRWGKRSALSVLDQGVFSGSNFILTLLLARWLAPGDYGAFSVAFSIFLFSAGFHGALILDPLMVLGSSRTAPETARYLGSVVWLHAAVCGMMSAALAGAAAILTVIGSPLTGSLLMLAIASPFILLFWVFRAACYLGTRPDLALGGSAVYALVLFLALSLLVRSRHVSAPVAFLSMGLAGTGGAALLFLLLRIRGSDLAWRSARPQLRAIVSENWRYGKWVTGSAVVYWLSGALYVPLVGSFVGLAAAGAFQALLNLVRPLQQGVTALSALFLPRVSRQRVQRTQSAFQRSIWMILAMNATFALVYLVLLFVAGKWLVSFLYRRSFYGEFVTLIPLVWLTAFLSVVTQALAIGLKAVQRSDLLFRAHTIGAVAAVSLGLLFVHFLKVPGAIISAACSGLVLATAHFLLLRPWLRRAQ